MAVTNVVSWRSERINYKKNEVFLDVVESVNILVNSNGQIIRSDVMIQIFWICTVCGEPLSQTAQSFMPELMYGVNQSLEKVLHSFEFSQTMPQKKSKKKNISTQHEVTQPQSNQPQPIPSPTHSTSTYSISYSTSIHSTSTHLTPTLIDLVFGLYYHFNLVDK
ncbi:AP-1 complex subunit mu-1-I-like [Vicia villosa]|uniref:AP-1 complex subunit mu-1-I-like n=1 Tax=Vicia villosa TaxID=3911 RepID=UPI00273BF18A|nr:AP-1 complex subunit mu-1-I-like [Vicia villosa]